MPEVCSIRTNAAPRTRRGKGRNGMRFSQPLRFTARTKSIAFAVRSSPGCPASRPHRHKAPAQSRWPIVGPPRQLAHGGRHSISIRNGMTGLPSVPDDSLPNLQTHIPGTEKRPVLNRSESEGYLGVGRMPCPWDCRKFRFQASSHPMEMVGNEKETAGISSKS